MLKRKPVILIFLIWIIFLSIIFYGYKKNTKCPKINNLDYSKPEDNLIIKGVMWSGATPCQYSSVTNSYKVELNQEITFDCQKKCKNLIFKIVEKNYSYIIIETSENMYDESLTETKKEFKIEKNKKTEIKTPTMDFGYVYTIEYK